MAKTIVLTAEEKVLLGKLIDGATMAIDPLPYTDEFSRMKQNFQEQTGRTLSNADFWISIKRIGQKGGHSGKKRTLSPKLTDIQKLEIRRLLPEGTGARDRLPYTPEFKEIHNRFSKLTQTKLNERDFWRALLSVAKERRKSKALFVTLPHGRLLPGTIDILKRGNPWWLAEKGKETKDYRRWAFDEVWRSVTGSAIPATILSGPRRVGKTIIQDQVIEQLLLMRGAEPQQILHVQFDELPWLGSLTQPIISIVSWYEKQVLKMSLNEFVRKGKQIYLFFDEVQNLNSWAQELKNIIDHVSEGGLKVLATGSSSLRIKRDQYALAGRSKQIDLGPLRLREIIGIRDLGVLPCVKDKNILENWTDRNFWLDLLNYGEKHSKLIEKSFEYYSRLGGFPYCHNKDIIVEDESELAKWMVDSVIDRTIFYDLPVNSTGRSLNKEVLSQTFKQICRHTGQSLSIEKLRSEIFDLYQSEITQKDIIQALQYFEDSMLMCKIAPLEIGARRQRHGYKLCLCDHFLRQANLQEKIPISPSSLINVNEVVSTMAGHIIEGLIGYALHSIPAMDIAWFPERRNEPELDFVLTMGLKRLPIEVKYKRNRPKNGDLAGLRSFCCQKKYNAEFGLLITQEYTGPIGDNVIAIPASTFLSIL